MMFRKAITTWLLMVVTAIINGVLRRAVVEPVVGDLGAHQVSVVTGSAAFLGVTYLMLHHDVEREADRTLLRIGGAWVLATEIFEFGFGHYVAGSSWNELLRDYNLAQGRAWPVVLVVLFFAPLLVKRWVTRHHQRHELQRV